MARARSDAQRRRQASLGSGDARRDLMRFLPLSAALSALLACPAWPARWDIVPTLSVGEFYTDNLSLTPDALKRSDWVTQVIPGITVAAFGPALRFRASYAPELLYYSQGGADNKVYQQINAVGTAELAKQLLFVDAGALIGPENISLLGPVTDSNINTTGNRTTVRTFFVSPYLRQNFGSAVQGEARFNYSVWNSDDTTALSNSVANRVSLRLASGPAYKLLTWNLSYVTETVDYETLPNTNTELTLANARRLITPTVGLLAQAGYENYESGVVGPESAGPRWSAGFEWTPSPRTRLAATAGERFFGHTYYFDFRHRTRLTTWSAGYTEDISNARSESLAPDATSTAGYLDPLFLSSIPDPEARHKAVDEVVAQWGLPPSLSAPVDFFSGLLFLVKRWQASAGLLGVRNVLIANVFNETREVAVGSVVLPGAGDFAASNIIRQTGTSLAWSWRVTAQNTWNLRAGYTRDEFPDIDRVDDRTEIRMALTRRFQPRLSGSLYYRRQQNNSNVSASSYKENSVSATLQMRF